MFKKTAITTVAGLMAATMAMSANAFTIMGGNFKMTVDGYVNGTIYDTSAPGTICSSVAGCDSVALLPATGATGSVDSWGILSVSSIVNTATNTTMFSRGVDGYMIGSVTGITDFTSVALSPGFQKDYATGGAINLYLSSTNYNPSVLSSNQAAVIASITNLPLYLSLDFAIGAGNSGVGATASYISTFDTDTTTGSGSGYLNVTGGTAAPIFDSNAVTTAAGGVSDASFNVTLAPMQPGDAGIAGGWLATSTSAVYGTALPEPGSMALMGLGMFGLAALRRRRTS